MGSVNILCTQRRSNYGQKVYFGSMKLKIQCVNKEKKSFTIISNMRKSKTTKETKKSVLGCSCQLTMNTDAKMFKLAI